MVASTDFRIRNHDDDGELTISAKISGAATRLSCEEVGDIVLDNDNNDFTGYLYKINGSSLSLSSIADSGVASAAGAGDDIQIGYNGKIRYMGSTDSYTDRTLHLVASGNVNLDSDGSGILVLTGAVSNELTVSRTLAIGGSNTGANEIQGELKDNGANLLSLRKRGAGRWILSGTNTYTGNTTIEDGTLEIGGGIMALTNNVTYTVDGVLSINGGTISNSIDMTFSGDGLIKQQSGVLSVNQGISGGNPIINTDMEVSGGVINMGGQVRVGDGVPTELKVVGSAADITFRVLNQRAWTGDSGIFRFILDESGVSPIKVTAFLHLEEAAVIVDGTDFNPNTEGITRILLFDSSNLQTSSTDMSYVNFHPFAKLQFVEEVHDVYLEYTPPPNGTVILVH